MIKNVKKKPATQQLSQPRKKQIADLLPKLEAKHYLALAVIVIVSLIAYLPALKNGFVNWDDDRYVQENALITTINLKEIFSQNVMGNYHPLTILLYAIQYHYFQLSASGYHTVNLIIHLLNVVLVFYFIYYFSEKIEVALIAALLFGVHPLHVESVAWVSELKDLLYTFFFMATLIMYMKYLKNKKTSLLIFAVILFFLSLISKAMAASLPVVLVLIDYFKGRKFDTKVILEKAPFFILAIIFGVISIYAQQESEAISDTSVFGLPQRVVFASYGFMAYIAKLIVPVNLVAFYPYPVKSGVDIPTEYFIYPVLLIGLLAYVFYSLKFSKKIFFGVGFFAVTVFLVLQLLPVGAAIMADRYAYIPSIGFFYLAAEGIYWMMNSNRFGTSLRMPAFIITAIVCILFSYKTYSQSQVWKNGLTLWDNVLNVYPDVATALNNRGKFYGKDLGNIDQALKDLNASIKNDPTYEKAYSNRGIVFCMQGKFDLAIKDFNEAIRMKPDYYEAITNRGIAYAQLKKPDMAFKDFSKAIEIEPNKADNFLNRGVCYLQLSDATKALNDFNKGISLNPNLPDLYLRRSTAYFNLKQFADAYRDVQTAKSMGGKVDQAYFEQLQNAAK